MEDRRLMLGFQCFTIILSSSASDGCGPHRTHTCMSWHSSNTTRRNGTVGLLTGRNTGVSDKEHLASVQTKVERRHNSSGWRLHQLVVADTILPPASIHPYVESTLSVKFSRYCVTAPDSAQTRTSAAPIRSPNRAVFSVG